MIPPVKKRNWLYLLGVSIALLITGIYLENSITFAGYQELTKKQTIETNLLNYGNLGKILKRNGNIISLASPQYKQKPKLEEYSSNSIFSKKSSSSNLVYLANPGGKLNFPSSLAVPTEELAKGWPVISVVVDEKYLFGNKEGIITNDGQKGSEWERLAHVSYFENGNLLFSTGSGLRAHGGRSRGLFNDVKSLRLYFRKEYGAEQLPENLLFNGKADPLKRVVLRISQYRPGDLFLNAMAFDISRKLGAITPETSPARLFLNGEDKGIYFISEHLKKEHWENHIGHDHFYFYRDRGKNDHESTQAYEKTLEWAKNKKILMTVEEASKRVDLDNFTNHIISVIFCGTTDWEQGAAVRDYSTPEGRWHWVNWDMDQSFRDFAYESRTENLWEQRAMLLILGDGNISTMRLRPALFLRLYQESPEFRSYFVKKMTFALNHLLTDEFLSSRLDHYNAMLDKLNWEKRNSLKIMKVFLANRKSFLAEELDKYFNTGKPLSLQVKAANGGNFKVDGRLKADTYNGVYFPGDRVLLSIDPDSSKVFKHWVVNGKKVTTAELELPVERDTKIRLVTWKKEK